MNYPNGISKSLEVTKPLELTHSGETLWSGALAVAQDTPMSEELGVVGNLDPLWLSMSGCAKLDFSSMQLDYVPTSDSIECPFTLKGDELKVEKDDTIQVGTEKYAVILDTGAAVSSIIEKRLNGSEQFIQNGRIHLIWGVKHTEFWGPFETSINGVTLKSPLVAVHEDQPYPGADGFVGIDLLSESMVVIKNRTYHWTLK